MKALTGVQNVDLRVRPEPGALLVGLVVLYGRKQDHDVSKEPPLEAFFEQRQDENGFSASRLPADNFGDVSFSEQPTSRRYSPDVKVEAVCQSLTNLLRGTTYGLRVSASFLRSAPTPPPPWPAVGRPQAARAP